MLTAVKIIALAVILAFACLGLGILWLLRKVRSFVKASAEAPGCPPCRVNPQPDPNPQWRSAAKIARYTEEFRALGFREVGAFSIPEMAGLQMLVFYHAGQGFYGIVYDHKMIEPTFEIGCDFGNGSGLCATSSSAGDTLDARPNNPILWLGTNSVKEVLDAARKHPQPAPRRPVSPAEFLSHFKKKYAEGMSWRLRKGGVSRDEIRRQAEKKGMQLDSGQLEESYRRLRASYLRETQSGCVAQYVDDRKPSTADWERIRKSVFAIPETMELKEVLQSIEEATGLDEDQRHQLSKVESAFGESALDIVDRILRQNVGALGLQRIGEVNEPVRACLLAAPSA